MSQTYSPVKDRVNWGIPRIPFDIQAVRLRNNVYRNAWLSICETTVRSIPWKT